MKRIYRSQDNRIVAGVLGGLGNYLNIDPTILRLLFIIGLMVSAGTLVFVYIVAIFIVPNEWDVY